MKNVLIVGLAALTLSAGAAVAEPPPAELTGSALSTVQDSLSQHTVADLTNVVGGARSHSCRTNSVAGAVLTTAGLALGFHWLTAIGTHLILLSETVCY